MEDKNLYQIAQAGQSLPNRIKKSKFIPSTAPISSIQDAKHIITRIKNQFPKVTHHCWGYRIYTLEGIFHKFDDDGKPTGTAGSPILYVLEKENIVNAIMIVTRYYGGKK